MRKSITFVVLCLQSTIKLNLVQYGNYLENNYLPVVLLQILTSVNQDEYFQEFQVSF